MLRASDIFRLDLGYFIRPASETANGHDRIEPCLAYAIRLPDGVFLFDTGIGSGWPEVQSHYQPVRRSLAAALRSAKVRIEDVRWVANCHLHFDHCGGNPLFEGRPIFTQASELATARALESYTLPDLIDFAGVVYEELHGEAEIKPGLFILPTPGHTEGHQSLVVRCTDGTTVLAGQAYNLASDMTSDWLAREVVVNGLPTGPHSFQAWLDRLSQFDPARVLFAHDLSVWEPEKLFTQRNVR